jgi:hypothetical protein
MLQARFSLGQIVSTPGAEDRLENERSVSDGCRILSAYHLRDGTKIWVITEADRSATTILLPEEY